MDKASGRAARRRRFSEQLSKNSYAVELKALVQKRPGRRIEVPAIAVQPQGNVVNIMDALIKSLKAEAPTAKENAKPAPAKKRSTR